MKETKFKDTEVGRIPEDWEATRIDKLCCLKARIGWQGLTTGEYLSQGDYVLVTGTDFNDGYIEWKNCCYVNKWRYDQDINIQIKEGDVLISKDGTIGKVAFLDSIPGPGTLNSGVFVVRPKQDNVINKAYLSWIFKSIWFKSFIDQLTAGSTINHLYQKDFVKFQLVYPNDISEQSRIASALSSIDNLLAALDKLIAKKRDIKQGTMQQLLTGKKRLKGFTEPWVEKKLGEIVVVKRGVRVVRGQLIEDGLFPVFQNTNIPLGYFNMNNVKGGTPFVIIGGSAGQIGICETDYWAADDCAYFDCGSKMSSKFLYFLLLFHHKEIQGNVRSASVPRLDRKILMQLLISAPSLPEQQAIASVLTSMDNELSALEAKRKKYEQIKQGMMQQLLTGKIRLENASMVL